MTKDPIGGMTVDEAAALRAERDGETVYFCSEHCRQKFSSSPATAEVVRNLLAFYSAADCFQLRHGDRAIY